MTKDDIMQALRLTAMGRVGHPLQEELVEKLAAVFAQPGRFVDHPLGVKPDIFSIQLQPCDPADDVAAMGVLWNGPRNLDGSAAPMTSMIHQPETPKRARKAKAD